MADGPAGGGKTGVFGWYRPAAGLSLRLTAEWRGLSLEVFHFSAEENLETPIEFDSFRSMAEFMSRHAEVFNDALNERAVWEPRQSPGLVGSWPAAGGEVRLRCLRPPPPPQAPPGGAPAGWAGAGGPEPPQDDEF